MIDRDPGRETASPESGASHDPVPRGRGPLGTILLLGGAALCVLVTADGLAALPIDMPSSWYVNKPLWLGVGVALLLAGFGVLRPPKGDESDTG